MEELKGFGIGMGGLTKEINKIIDSGEKVLIPSKDGKNLVILSEKEYNELIAARGDAE